jgi:hypothetical protein
MKRLFLLLVTCLLMSVSAWADGISISGTANQDPLNGVSFFTISSPTTTFAVDSAFIEFISPVIICSSGSVCNLTVTVPAFEGPGINEVQNFTWIDGTSRTRPPTTIPPGPPITGFVEGQLVFPIPGFMVSQPPNAFFSVSGTIPFSGQLSGFSGNFTNIQGQVFSVDLSGTATFSLFGRESSDGTFATFSDSKFNFEGTATPIPEPSTFLLVGSGVLAFVRRARMRRPSKTS